MGHLALGVLHKRMFTKSQLTMLMAAALPIDADSELVSEPEIQLPVAANGKLEHWASMPRNVIVSLVAGSVITAAKYRRERQATDWLYPAVVLPVILAHDNGFGHIASQLTAN